MKYLSPYSIGFKIILTAISAFTIYRLCFLFFNLHSIPDYLDHAAYTYYRSFILGLNFDLVICSYIIAPFVIFLFLRQICNRSFAKGCLFFKWYFILLFSICFLICAADIPYFKQFATHLNRDAFNWASTPGFVIQLIFSDFSYWGFLLFFLMLVTLIYWKFSLFFSSIPSPVNALKKTGTVGAFLLLALFVFIGIRGRTALKSPIKIGTAYFSEHAFFNQLGLNPCYVFFHSLKKEKEWDLLAAPVLETELKTARAQISNRSSAAQTDSITRSASKYNVVLVLMESMSMTKMGHHHCAHLTNRFDTIVQQGLFFNQFYSSGIHTFNGLFSTETGFPSILNTQPLETYTNKAFKGISYWLKQNGYNNYFFTSNDGQFDNMEGFMKFNHFDNFYSHEDYPSDKVVSTMGVPDHYLLEFALKKMDTHVREKNTPFFSYILTSSDHGPWTVPTDISFKPTAESEQDRATQYADWALGNFIEQAKKYSWFDNTLFIFVGDHGVNFGHTYAMPLSFHHIPCVFYMPSHIKPHTVSNIGGQIDVLPTLLGFLNIPFNNTSMGIDLLHENRPYMYFTADSKIGAIDQHFYYFDLLEEQKEMLYVYENLDTKNYIDLHKSKADSMKAYSYKMIRVANHIIKNKLY